MLTQQQQAWQRCRPPLLAQEMLGQGLYDEWLFCMLGDYREHPLPRQWHAKRSAFLPSGQQGAQNNFSIASEPFMGRDYSETHNNAAAELLLHGVYPARAAHAADRAGVCAAVEHTGHVAEGSETVACTEEAVPADCADEVLPGAVCASAAAGTAAAPPSAAEAAGGAAWVPAWLKSCCSWGTDPIMPSKASIRGEMSMLADAEDPTWTFTVLPCIQQAAFQ